MANINEIVWTLLQPAHALLLLLVAGTVLTCFRGTRRWGLRLNAAAVSVLVLVALFPVGAWLLHSLEERFPPPPLLREVDGILVLGGGQNMVVTADRGHVTLNDHAERLIEAAALFRRYPDAERVFTGGNAHGGWTEADVARLTFDAMGIDAATVFFDEAGGNTHDSAVRLGLSRARGWPLNHQARVSCNHGSCGTTPRSGAGPRRSWSWARTPGHAVTHRCRRRSLSRRRAAWARIP